MDHVAEDSYHEVPTVHGGCEVEESLATTFNDARASSGMANPTTMKADVIENLVTSQWIGKEA